MDSLKTSLQSAQADLESKESVLKALEEAKAETEKELSAARESLATLQASSTGDVSTLEAVRAEVRAFMDCLAITKTFRSWRKPGHLRHL